MIVRIKKLVEEAVIPIYQHETDAGMDMTATSVNITEDFIEYGTGLSVEIPNGYVGLIFPRSSVSKYDLQLCNSVGVIDSGFLGEVRFRFNILQNDSVTANTFESITGSIGLRDSKIYNVGDKIGQLIILPFPKVVWQVVEDLEQSERGENGFGSSGN